MPFLCHYICPTAQFVLIKAVAFSPLQWGSKLKFIANAKRFLICCRPKHCINKAH